MTSPFRMRSRHAQRSRKDSSGKEEDHGFLREHCGRSAEARRLDSLVGAGALLVRDQHAILDQPSDIGLSTLRP